MQNQSNLFKINYFLFFFILLVSCKSSQHDKNAHKVTKEFDTQYSNSQYEFSYITWGTFETITSWDSVKKYMPKKDRKRFSKNMFLTGADFPLLKFSPTKHYIFVYPITKKNKNQVLERLDSANKIFEKIYKHPTKNYFIHFYAHDNTKLENYSAEVFTQGYRSSFDSVKVGKDYKVAAPENPFSIANEAFSTQKDSTGNYVLPLLKLDYYSENYQTEREKANFTQTSATYHSFIHRSEKLPLFWKEYRNLTYFKKIEEDTLPSFLVNDEKAIDFLVEKASQNQVVMLNEVHFDPQHRLLVNHLLEKLYKQGFRFLALEALGKHDEEINKRGFIIQKSGFYTREPAMADLIRQAHNLGFYIFGYDDYGKDREKKQAATIFDKTIAKDRDAKVIVFAGFGHISEKKAKTDKQRNMMAVEFELLSGINPLTIDQVEYMNKANNWLSIIDTAFDNGFIEVDIKIANSFYNFPQERKEIKYTFSDSIKTELNIERTEYKGSLKVYNLEEWKITKQAVPFQVLAIKDENFVNLFLNPNQEYHLEISDPQGGVIFEENLKAE
ncbi:hypothetical protein V9L05_11440 [Bernardetia sp. Wsw4-3y2]|uniref:hypothetical protein n=1 Tax=Bernardetia sp. Wsw4-3y2 TaxID=3127471 RepID=UPI0030CE3935